MQLLLATSEDAQLDYLSLPLHQPLADWADPRLVEIPMGVHRHVVRFVGHEGSLLALKELPTRLANREWRLLQALRDEELPVVEVLGIVSERAEGLDDLLITRHLEFSLPFRFLFLRSGVPHLHLSLVDAVAVLLVRLHLAGFFWGDCSLSNTLFRRDAGALSAWVVDVETGELHPRLTDGQRHHDLEIAQLNVLGGLLDAQASGRLPADVDPVDVSVSLVERYAQLWSELTTEVRVDFSERHLIDERIRRLNLLGFDITQITIHHGEDRSVVRFRPEVVEAGHHQRRLKDLTGLDALENQARRLLNDLRSYGAWLSAQEGRELPEAVAAYRWLTNVFEPALAAIPEELRDRREAAELFHEILEHRDALVAARHRPVRVPEAAASYASVALPFAENERSVLDALDD